MPNEGLTEFLRDTSLYVEAMPSIENQQPTLLLHLALAEISTHVLDIYDKFPVEILITEQHYLVILGKIGTYLISPSPENLKKIALRMYAVSHNKRFIHAILGIWPA